MADQTIDVITGDLPTFSNTGTDYFGPCMATKGRCHSLEKRYGVIFSSLVSRAEHKDISHSISHSLRSPARRGNLLLIRSDNGTILVAGNRN